MAPSTQFSPMPDDLLLGGRDERMFLAALSPVMQGCPNPEVVRAVLAAAKAQGYDYRKIYSAAVAERPSHWPPAPPLEEVEPDPRPPDSTPA